MPPRSGELLEPRAMLATYTVTSFADAGAGTLRDAITSSNANPGNDTIEFRITGGAPVINLLSALPSITDPVLIDGTTQPGYLTSPIVEIKGATVADAGLRIDPAGSGTTIKALSIYGLQYTPTIINAANGILSDSGNAIVIDTGATSNAIIGCYLGTDAALTAGIGNAVAGVMVFGDDTTISDCVITGNGGSGVILVNDTGTTLTGNLIGRVTATATLPTNAAHGILARGSASTTIGGLSVAQRNVISGNGSTVVNPAGDSVGVGDGIRLEATTDTSIRGNYIGVDAATGGVAVANLGAGISADATNLTIGTGTAAGRNVISGNDQQGILLRDGTATIQGNYVGVAANGTAGAGNVLEGIRIDGGTDHTIGGTIVSQGNVISANGASGITVTREAGPVLMQQNLIGLGVTLADLGNGGDGITLDEASFVTITYVNRIAYNDAAGISLTGASNNRIGADTSRPVGEQGLDFGNAIYANDSHGILLQAESNDNVLAANLIGLATPNGALQGNTGDGISIQSSSNGNVIGGLLPSDPTVPVLGNVIAGNTAFGVSITDCDALTVVVGNVVQGNTIRNNASHGILIDDASNQVVGGTLATNANTIMLNSGNGVEIRNGSRGIAVVGNYVGTTSSGVLGFGNAGIGIRVLQSNASVIGGDSAAGNGNLVVGNKSDGIVITRVDDAGVTAGDASLNLVQGNAVRANSGSGIRITSASDNQVGGTTAVLGNIVGNSGADGLRIETNADGNTILGNTFGGSPDTGNASAGIRITSSNENLIGSAAAGGGNTISRNSGAGIVVTLAAANDLANGNQIVGNTIDANLSNGIVLAGSTFQTIGGAIGAAGTPANSVTRNRGAGIVLTSAVTGGVTVYSNENLIRSNFVGTDVSGNSLGNAAQGVSIAAGSYNVLSANTIGRNTLAGITIDGGGTAAIAGFATGNRVGGALPTEGNLVIANKAGGILVENGAIATSIVNTRVESNTGIGISIRGSSVTVDEGTAVVLSTSDGIAVADYLLQGRQFVSAGTTVIGAYVGTDAAGTTGLGNQGMGIRLAGTFGVTVDAGTVVAENKLGGIRIANSPTDPLTQVGNTIRGATIRDNFSHGVSVTGSNYHTIGGTVAGYGNTISENALDGVALFGNSAYLSVQGNTVVANLRHGISLTTVNDSTISGGNQIVGNGQDGVNVASGSTRNTIQENAIGQSAAGVANGNNRDGIGIYSANGNAVVDNVVGSNLQNGITLSSAVAGGPATGNRVQGNLITENLVHGVNVLASRNQVVGGTGVNEPNIITDNGVDGVFVGSVSAAIYVVGNLIGLDELGADAGNAGDGVEVNNSLGVIVRANTIAFNDANGLLVSGVKGTPASPTLVQSNTFNANDGNGVAIRASSGTLLGTGNAGNTITLSGNAGVRIDQAATGNTVAFNSIGTDFFGRDLGNGTAGILIANAVGNTVNNGNKIAFNDVGVQLLDAIATTTKAGNRIDANLITQNDGDGIQVAGSAFNSIGAPGLSNSITLNVGAGVAIVSSARNPSRGNVVRANFIGTDPSLAGLGNLGDGLRIAGGSANVVDQNTITDNTGAGVRIAASSGNVIGSNVAGAANTIAGNGLGIVITDTDGATTATTRDNSVLGNTITGSAGNGITVTGSKTLVTVIGGSTVGGSVVGRGNVIRDNTGVGIEVTGGAQQVSMQANSVVDNAGGGIVVAPGSNLGTATPTVTSAQLMTPSRGTRQLIVRGTLTGAVATQQYQLDVYSSRPADGDAATGTGFGGRVFLGRFTVTATRSGTIAYTIQVNGIGAILGDYVTVMSTNLRPPAPTSSAFSALAVPITIQSPVVAAAASASAPRRGRAVVR